MENTPDRVQQIRRLISSKQVGAALIEAKRLVAEHPAMAEAHDLEGVCLGMQGSLETAIERFRTATRLNPGAAVPHYHLAVALKQCEEFEEAVEECQTTLLISPTHEAARNLQQEIKAILRDRAHTDANGFGVVDASNDPTKRERTEWMKLECPICGGKNYVTAKVCRKCNCRLPDEDPVIPVE